MMYNEGSLKKTDRLPAPESTARGCSSGPKHGQRCGGHLQKNKKSCRILKVSYVHARWGVKILIRDNASGI